MELSREHLNAAATATHEATREAFAQDRGASACAAVCRRLNQVIDAEFAAQAPRPPPIACAPGCSFCCHLRVTVFRHEGAALLHHLRTQMPATAAAAVEQRIRANAQRIDGMTAGEHRAAGIPCAFLIDGRCSAHEVRPAACAVYHSLSRERCEFSHRHPQGIGTASNARPALLTLQAFGAALIEATRAGLEDAGLEAGQAELHQLVRELMDEPSVGL